LAAFRALTATASGCPASSPSVPKLH
jgi:hypothetical protein